MKKTKIFIVAMFAAVMLVSCESASINETEGGNQTSETDLDLTGTWELNAFSVSYGPYYYDEIAYNQTLDFYDTNAFDMKLVGDIFGSGVILDTDFTLDYTVTDHIQLAYQLFGSDQDTMLITETRNGYYGGINMNLFCRITAQDASSPLIGEWEFIHIINQDNLEWLETQEELSAVDYGYTCTYTIAEDMLNIYRDEELKENIEINPTESVLAFYPVYTDYSSSYSISGDTLTLSPFVVYGSDSVIVTSTEAVFLRYY